jgi:hypothetical protein
MHHLMKHMLTPQTKHTIRHRTRHDSVVLATAVARRFPSLFLTALAVVKATTTAECQSPRASSATATRQRLGLTKPTMRAVRPVLCNPATASMAIAISIVLPQRNQRVLGATEQCILIVARWFMLGAR